MKTNGMKEALTVLTLIENMSSSEFRLHIFRGVFFSLQLEGDVWLLWTIVFT